MGSCNGITKRFHGKHSLCCTICEV
jgi:hypothetical protein